MSRLPQLSQDQPVPPWYRTWFMPAGIGLVAVALLILVPSRWLANLANLRTSFPKWLHETYIWKRYGPTCILGEPRVDCQRSQDGNAVSYIAHVSLCVKNRYDNPLRISASGMKLGIEQNRRHTKSSVELGVPLSASGIESRSGVQLQPQQSNYYNIGLDITVYNNPLVVLPDISGQSYRWVIHGINVDSAGINRRNLSKRGKTRSQATR